MVRQARWNFNFLEPTDTPTLHPYFLFISAESEFPTGSQLSVFRKVGISSRILGAQQKLKVLSLPPVLLPPLPRLCVWQLGVNLKVADNRWESVPMLPASGGSPSKWLPVTDRSEYQGDRRLRGSLQYLTWVCISWALQKKAVFVR